MWRGFAIILLSVLISSALVAQERSIRISPPDPPEPITVANGEIQSAGRIGARTLVVWGTSHHFGSDTTFGSFGTELRMQLLDGTSRVGDERAISGPDALPYGVVAVVTLGDRFIVLWNDMRPAAPGIYRRDVGIDGNAMGDEILFAAGGKLESDASLWLNDDAGGGYRLVWNDVVTGSGCYVRLDRTGSAIDGGALGLVNFDDTLRFSALPGVKIDRVRNDNSRFIHADGHADPRAIPDSHLFSPFYLRGDTSLLTLEWKSSTQLYLCFYRSIFDVADTHRVLLPRGPGNIHEPRAIIIDSTGAISVVFKGMFPDGGSAAISIFVYYIRQRVFPNDSIGDTVRLGSELGFTPCCDGPSVDRSGGIVSETVVTGDDNCSQSTIHTHTTAYDKQSNTLDISDQVDTMRLTSEGVVFGTNPALAPSAGRDIRSRVSVARSASADSSVVRAGVDSNMVRLAAPKATRERNLAQTRPAVVIVHGVPVVTWRQAATIPTFGLAPFAAADSSSPRRLYTPDPRLATSSSSGGHSTYTDYFPNVGGAVATGIWDFTYPDRLDRTKPHGSCSYTIALPSDTGWRKVYSVGSVDCVPMTTTIARDPLTGEIIGVTALDGGYTPRLFLLGGDGARRGEVGNFTAPAQALVPIGDSAFIVLAGKKGRLYTTLVDWRLCDLIDSLDPLTTVQRLYGDRFLVTHVESPTSASHLSLRLDLYSLTGAFIRREMVVLPSSAPEISIIQRPSDNVLCILQGAGDGVHLTMLDTALAILTPDRIISDTRDSVARPSGAFMGDSLYVAWEDYRSGEPDIYGARLATGDDIPSTGEPAPLAITQLAPIPTHGPLEIDLDLKSSGSVGIEFYDDLGRRVRGDRVDGVEKGHRQFKLDVSDLHPGVYMLIISAADGERGEGRIVVLH
jgi:hypothetical protein